MINVSIIGSGNVATHLAHVFTKNNIAVEYIISRNEDEGTQLANSIQATFFKLEGNISFHSTNIIIVAVKDDAIEEMGHFLQHCTIPVAHTSGTMSSSLLSKNCPETGVFYPLQSFTKGKQPDFDKIPIIVDSEDEGVLVLLTELAQTISKCVVRLTDLERQKIHVAAVISNNFSNHLWYLAERYCKQNNLEFKLLHPLIEETIEKLKILSPYLAQTGPARRHDATTISVHIAELQNYPDLQEIYLGLSNSIEKHYP